MTFMKGLIACGVLFLVWEMVFVYTAVSTSEPVEQSYLDAAR